MEKRRLIDAIMQINNSATPGFLAEFETDELRDYLGHLRIVQTPRPCSDPSDPVAFDTEGQYVQASLG